MRDQVHQVNQPSLAPPTRPPFWRNATFLKWAAQIGALVGVAALGFVLIGEALSNMRAQGLSLDWDLLTDPPGIQLGEGIFTHPQTGLEAFYTGAVNMLRVALSGIVAATLVGLVVGVSRLSSNWLASRLATVFVETFRNIPVLVQVVFWFFFASILFPSLGPDSSGPIPGWLLVSRKGVSFAWPFPQETFWQWAVFLGVGLLLARRVYRRRLFRVEEAGEDARPLTWAVVMLLAVAAVGWYAHPLAGAVGWAFGGVAASVRAIPLLAYQVILAAISIYFGQRWIRRFLDSRRSPAGLAKLTDDDYFRMAMAGLVGIVGAAALLMLPGITELGTELVGSLLEFFNRKFDFLRVGAPLAWGQPSVELPGRFPQIADTGMTMTPLLLRDLDGSDAVHVRFCGRDRQRRRSLGSQRPERGGIRAGAAVGAAFQDGDPPAGLPGNTPSLGKSIPESGQEHLAGHRRGLPGDGAGWPDHVQSDR